VVKFRHGEGNFESGQIRSNLLQMVKFSPHLWCGLEHPSDSPTVQQFLCITSSPLRMRRQSHPSIHSQHMLWMSWTWFQALGRPTHARSHHVCSLAVNHLSLRLRLRTLTSPSRTIFRPSKSPHPPTQMIPTHFPPLPASFGA